MEKSFVNNERTFVTNGQASPVAQPGEGAFDFPPMTVAAQCATVLSAGFDSIVTMRADHLDTTSLEAVTQRIAVVACLLESTYLPRCLSPKGPYGYSSGGGIL